MIHAVINNRHPWCVMLDVQFETTSQQQSENQDWLQIAAERDCID